MSERRDWTDIGFTVLIEPGEYCVDYKLYEIVGEGDNGPVFELAGSVSCEPTEDINQAEVFASGGVKWDGCSNWKFDIQDQVMIHACGRKFLLNIGEALARCWDVTGQILPTWDKTITER